MECDSFKASVEQSISVIISIVDSSELHLSIVDALYLAHNISRVTVCISDGELHRTFAVFVAIVHFVGICECDRLSFSHNV
jgi:hypothetical protein